MEINFKLSDSGEEMEAEVVILDHTHYLCYSPVIGFTIAHHLVFDSKGVLLCDDRRIDYTDTPDCRKAIAWLKQQLQ